MADKWNKLQGKVPEAPASDMTSAADEKFLPRVEKLKAELAGLPLAELMSQLLTCNEEWDALEAQKKELNVSFEALSQLILKQFRAQGLSVVKNEAGKTFKIHTEPYISVKKGRRDEAEAWVAADPARDYLWSIHPQSLASWVKTILEKLEDEKTEDDKIPEFIDVFSKTSIQVK
jgi:hypothetical protein